VLAHSEALLQGTPEGVTRYIEADVRKPEELLELAGTTIDFRRPVALSLIALMHFVPDEDRAYELVERYVAALAPGSYLALSQMTGDFDPENVARGVAAYAAGGVALVPRTHAGVSRFFDGLELVEPGVVPVADWHAEPNADDAPTETVPIYGGIGRKRT
jgi:hypothetical protein